MRHLRKRGADMTQALLYAAFAIIVLISVLAMYQVVSFNAAKTRTVMLLTNISNESRILYRGGSFGGLTTAKIIEAGVIPRDSVITGNRIGLPYGGEGDLFGSADVAQITITWPSASRSAKNLCTFLASGDKAVSEMKFFDMGPLGTDYAVGGFCDGEAAGGTPALIVQYLTEHTQIPNG